VFQFTINFGSVFDGSKLWLELRVKPSNGNNWTIHESATVVDGHALRLFRAHCRSVTNNGVTGPMLQNATLTASKIASGEVVKSLNGCTTM
jgi:hypothetical protein